MSRPRSRLARRCARSWCATWCRTPTAPLIVQGTYILASAILTEAILSFLGAGVSTETPTWGNIMAEGRLFFRIKPELILYPASRCRCASCRSTFWAMRHATCWTRG